MATLLHYPLCPFSRSIRLALAECGVEVTLTEERPWEWRQGFLELNPAGSLPVLITDEHGPISGAYAISEYLDETAKGDGEARGFRLFPGETLSRAEARRLVDWFHRKFHDEVTAYLVEEKVYRRHGPNSGSPNIAAIRAGHENLRYHLAYMSHLAETRPWLSGEAPRFACMCGNATLAMVVSSTCMNTGIITPMVSSKRCARDNACGWLMAQWRRGPQRPTPTSWQGPSGPTDSPSATRRNRKAGA